MYFDFRKMTFYFTYIPVQELIDIILIIVIMTF
jgi:hypothetical protein